MNAGMIAYGLPALNQPGVLQGVPRGALMDREVDAPQPDRTHTRSMSAIGKQAGANPHGIQTEVCAPTCKR